MRVKATFSSLCCLDAVGIQVSSTASVIQGLLRDSDAHLQPKR